MRAGEAGEAERRARAVSVLIRAEKELAELEAAQDREPEDNADARAERLSWITELVAAHRAGACDAAGVELRRTCLWTRRVHRARWRLTPPARVMI